MSCGAHAPATPNTTTTRTTTAPDAVPYDSQAAAQQCEGGDGAACEELAYRLWNGIGVRVDHERAVSAGVRGCGRDHAGSCRALAELRFAGIFERFDAARATETALRACSLGEPVACALWAAEHYRLWSEMPEGFDGIAVCEQGAADACFLMSRAAFYKDVSLTDEQQTSLVERGIRLAREVCQNGPLPVRATQCARLAEELGRIEHCAQDEREAGHPRCAAVARSLSEDQLPRPEEYRLRACEAGQVAACAHYFTYDVDLPPDQWWPTLEDYCDDRLDGDACAMLGYAYFHGAEGLAHDRQRPQDRHRAITLYARACALVQDMEYCRMWSDHCEDVGVDCPSEENLAHP